MKPEHFFIAGAQRSGTTYLYYLCAEHPQIEMAQPVKPEPKFFMVNSLFELGLDYYEKKFFKGKGGVKIRGEKSTSYIEVEKAAQCISLSFPSAKIVFILRNPIERAVSNYWFSVKNRFETLPIEQAFMNEEERRQNFDPQKVSVSPYAYLKRGCYIDYIEMYEKYFAQNQIHIIINEQLKNSGWPLRNLFSFLDVEETYLPSVLQTVVNANEDRPINKLGLRLMSYLQDYFAGPNERLSNRLGGPIAEWQSLAQ